MFQSQSSAVTDDEGKESRSSKHGTERIIRTVYAQNKVCVYSQPTIITYLYMSVLSLFETNPGL